MDQQGSSVQGPPFFRSDRHIVRRIVKQFIDAGLGGVAWLIADLLWFNSDFSARRTLVWVLLSFSADNLFQLTSPLYRFTTIQDVIRLGFATLTLMTVGVGMRLLPRVLEAGLQIPNIVIGASLLTGMFWATVRLGRRVMFENSFKPIRRVGPSHRTLLVGAGRAGSLVAQELLHHPELGYRIVGFIDDSPEKQGAKINGIRVLGTCAQIAEVIEKFRITHAVLAIPTASGPTIRRIIDQIQGLKVKVKTVPGIFNLLGERNWKPDLQEISIEDILRREPIQLDHGAMSQVVDGKVVLITGAGGSIGSELTRQLAALKPKFLVLLGRGENSLWQIQRDLQSQYPNQPFALELMDIRNRHGLREVFEQHRPNIVLHAAAHKHVPFLETHPCEAVENNIFGTFNVAEAALDFGVERLVNISTDKAVNPTNVLGASKRIAECIVLDFAEKAGPRARFVSVRFGNVLGSRGSVVPIFREQIQHGGPMTVTHEDMTRFFMTVPEASQLVIQAALFGETSRVYVLDMGEPVRILDLAIDMAKLSGLTPGRDIQIEVVGLRPGEKIHEELFLKDERSLTQVHPKLMEANPQPIPAAVLGESLDRFRHAIGLPLEERQPEIVSLLKQMVPTYKPSVLGVGKFGGFIKDRRHDVVSFPLERNRRQRP